MNSKLGWILSRPDEGRTDKHGNKEYIIDSRAGSKGSFYYTKRFNPLFREPDVITPTAKIENYQHFIAELRQARLQARQTQFQLAKVIGSSQAAISRFELGQTNPTVAFLHTYAQAIGYDLTLNISKNP